LQQDIDPFERSISWQGICRRTCHGFALCGEWFSVARGENGNVSNIS